MGQSPIGFSRPECTLRPSFLPLLRSRLWPEWPISLSSRTLEKKVLPLPRRRGSRYISLNSPVHEGLMQGNQFEASLYPLLTMTTRDFLTNEIIFLKLSWMADFTLMTVEESGLLVQERGFQAVLGTSEITRSAEKQSPSCRILQGRTASALIWAVDKGIFFVANLYQIGSGSNPIALTVAKSVGRFLAFKYFAMAKRSSSVRFWKRSLFAEMRVGSISTTTQPL